MFVRTKILQLVSFRWISVQANFQKRYKLKIDSVGKKILRGNKRGKDQEDKKEKDRNVKY